MYKSRTTGVRLYFVYGLIVIVGLASLIVAARGPLTRQSRGAAYSLPVGVTLRPIDGGPNYYCSNGFTNACSSTFNGMSWDDPRFFPIGSDYSFYPSSSTATFKALGLNYTVRVTGDTDLTMLRNAGIWAIPSWGEGKNPGPETVGWHIEEPASWSDVTNEVHDAGSSLAGRFLQPAFTWNQLVYAGLSGTPGDGSMQTMMSSPISTSIGNVHLNLATADQYWFAGSNDSWMQTYSGPLIYGVTGPATVDQMARGSNYGDMVDSMRGWFGPTNSAPICPYIETDDGLLTGSGVRRITPPEFNWAVWSTIVHGARCVMDFGTTSIYGDGSTFGFSQTVLPGQTISMYNQAIATDGMVKSLAPVINSPFALNYASVTPGGYTFPTPHVVWDNGIDVMTKYYTGGSYSDSTGSFANGFYIFSSVRGSATQKNINATFKIADGYTGPVTVVGENRTVQAANGMFSDTFASASTVHVYEIGTLASTPSTPSATPTPSGTAGPTPAPAPSATTEPTPSPAPVPTHVLSPSGVLVGSNAVQSDADNDAAGSAEAFQYTAAQSGIVGALSVYIDTGSTATSASLGLYADNSGHPGKLLTRGTLASPKSGSWNTVSVGAAHITAGTKYWLALLGTGGRINFRDMASGGGPTENSARTTLRALPARWSSGLGYGNAPASFYARTLQRRSTHR